MSASQEMCNSLMTLLVFMRAKTLPWNQRGCCASHLRTLGYMSIVESGVDVGSFG